MTVGELVKELQSYPSDMIVTDGRYILDKENFCIIENFYNENLEIIDKVLAIG